MDVGTDYSWSDAQIFNSSILGDIIGDGTIGFPEAVPIEGYGHDVHYYIMGDDAFSLSQGLQSLGISCNNHPRQRVIVITCVVWYNMLRC